MLHSEETVHYIAVNMSSRESVHDNPERSGKVYEPLYKDLSQLVRCEKIIINIKKRWLDVFKIK